MRIKLGTPCKETITGFSGIATGHCTYISGCSQILITPKVADDGVFREAHWFDEQRIVTTGGEAAVLDNSSTPGPDKPAPVR